MLTQVYEISIIEEASAVSAIGVDHVGVLVGDGRFPRELPISAASDIGGAIVPPSKFSALFLTCDISLIASWARELNPSIVHLGASAEVLSPKDVASLKIIEELGQKAKQRLRQQGCSNVELKIANGYHGWSEHAPFDKVIVTAAPDLIPPPLIHQLKAGGKMVIPAGLPNTQQLILAEKLANGRMTMKEIVSVRFSQLEGTGSGL